MVSLFHQRHPSREACKPLAKRAKPWECHARSAHAVRTQCKVLYVGNYLNPSFGPFAEVCCSIVGFFKLLMHSGYDKFELSFIITYFHPFVPIFTPPPLFCMFLVVDG